MVGNKACLRELRIWGKPLVAVAGGSCVTMGEILLGVLARSRREHLYMLQMMQEKAEV